MAHRAGHHDRGWAAWPFFVLLTATTTCALGHTVALHTVINWDLAAVPAWRARRELALTQEVLAGATGVQARLIRPPYSSTPSALAGPELAAARRVADRGYLIVLADHLT